MIPLLIMVFIFNLLIAMAMKVLADGDMGNRVFSNKWVKLFLLIPPVSIVIGFLIIGFGVGYILYYLFKAYLSND